MKLKPVNGHLICKKDKDEAVTEGGIVLPETAVGDQETAKVLAAPYGSQFEVGNTILISKYDGEEIEFDGETYTLLSENDIYAIVVDEN